MNTPDNNHSSVNRVSFPLNEAVHQWLTPLLDSYYIADKGIDKAISKYQQQALLVTLPFYGNIDSHEQKKLVESGALNKLARYEGLSLGNLAGKKCWPLNRSEI